MVLWENGFLVRYTRSEAAIDEHKKRIANTQYPVPVTIYSVQVEVELAISFL